MVTEGVPFDVAFSLDEAELLAWIVIIGEQNGQVWDWFDLQFRKREATA